MEVRQGPAVSQPGAGVWGTSPDLRAGDPPTKGWLLAWLPAPRPGAEDTKEPHFCCLPRVPGAGSSVIWARKKA